MSCLLFESWLGWVLVSRQKTNNHTKPSQAKKTKQNKIKPNQTKPNQTKAK